MPPSGKLSTRVQVVPPVGKTIQPIVRAGVQGAAIVQQFTNAPGLADQTGIQPLPGIAGVSSAQHPVKASSGIQDKAGAFIGGIQFADGAVAADVIAHGRDLNPGGAAVIGPIEKTRAAVGRKCNPRVPWVKRDGGDTDIG